MVLLALEGLSVREALDQVRYDLRWKLALSLDLENRGFDLSVIAYWRVRLQKSRSSN